MLNTGNNPDPNKRVLKKIRRPNLVQRPTDTEPTIIDTATKYLTNDKIFLINSCLGLVEQNRKIRIGTQFINLHFDVTSSVVHSRPDSRIVTLNLGLNENLPIVPWEYTTKRLESYGDSELASWAQRIEKHYTIYPGIMAKYFEILGSNDPQTFAYLKKTKIQASLACKEIETKYSFRKLLTFSKRESTEILSSSYSECFLKEIGHTVDTFLTWSKAHGLPPLFESDCSAHFEVAKNFLECVTLKGGPVQEGPKYKTFLYDKNGFRQEVEGQYFNIVEPTPEGLFISGYFVMKKKQKYVDCEDYIQDTKKVRVLGEITPKFLTFAKEGDREDGETGGEGRQNEESGDEKIEINKTDLI